MIKYGVGAFEYMGGAGGGGGTNVGGGGDTKIGGGEEGSYLRGGGCRQWNVSAPWIRTGVFLQFIL